MEWWTCTPCCDGRRADLCMLIGHDPASISDFPHLLRTTDNTKKVSQDGDNFVKMRTEGDSSSLAYAR